MTLHRAHRRAGRPPGSPARQLDVGPGRQHDRPGAEPPAVGQAPPRSPHPPRSSSHTVRPAGRPWPPPPAGRPRQGASRRRLSTWWSPGTSAPPRTPGARAGTSARHSLAVRRSASRPRACWRPSSSSTTARSERVERPPPPCRSAGSRCRARRRPPARRRRPASARRRPPAGAARRSSPKWPRSPGPACRPPPTRRPGRALGRPPSTRRPALGGPPGGGEPDHPAADEHGVHLARSYGGPRSVPPSGRTWSVRALSATGRGVYCRWTAPGPTSSRAAGPRRTSPSPTAPSRRDGHEPGRTTMARRTLAAPPPPAASTTRRTSTTPAASAWWPTCRAARATASSRQALTVLERLAHRGASGAEVATGDGAGILVQVPHRFWPMADDAGFDLPEPGRYATGLVFLPTDPDDAAKARGQLAAVAAEEGLAVLGWREVPVDDSTPGRHGPAGPARGSSRSSWPRPAGAAVAERPRPRPAGLRACASGSSTPSTGSTSPPSRRGPWSTRACSPPTSCSEFYPELSDERLESGLALVHSRFSTNTFPSWPLAHPYRYLAHNGEINTLAGNRNWMRAREALLAHRPHPRRPVAGLPDLHPRGQRLGLLRRGARAAPPRRAQPAPRGAHDDPRGLGEPRRDGPGAPGLLPLPRLADGALGRPGRRRLHRRHGGRARSSTATACARPATG